MTALEITDLHVSYGAVDAVRGVSLSVPAGDVVAVVGPNGAGKSSMLHAINGLVPARSGTIRWRDADITRWAPERVARTGIAFVPEWRGVFTTLSIAENLRLAGCALPRERDLDDRIEHALRHFPALASRRTERAAVLSGGQRQQLALARALVADPQVLLLDEPSLGLAPLVLDSLFESLAALRAEGLTILLVEQNVARAIALADHVYALRAGAIERVGDPSQLVQDTEFRRRHLGFG